APARSAPGVMFQYNNAGFALLALLAEHVAGMPYVDLVQRHVFTPAGMSHSAVLRYDELDGDVAVGYMERDGLKTNVHAVPNCGIGDGGLFTTVADMVRLWQALDNGILVSTDIVSLMTSPHGRTPHGIPYGLGFWLDPVTDAVTLEGYDHGISFRSVHRPSTAVTWTVASNWTDGAWPLADELELLAGASTLR
ncbi:MAG: serine hydrolase domain-containing protein, partial [Acidimicrobiia bacterium]